LHYIYQTIAYTSGTTLTHSRFVLAGERTKVRISLPIAGGAGTADFNLSTGAVIGTTGTGAVARIEDFGSGIYRVSLTLEATETNTRQFSCQPLDAAGLAIYTGDGSSGLYTWGAQLETGDEPTSYIKTTASTATRLADDITIPLADFPWNGGSGTLQINGSSVTPVTSGSDLDIAGTCFAEGINRLESLVWWPS
ncbi:phage head spike fiber domain-containing protein, partial [Pseudohoeflea coraliihabitans]